MISRDERTGLKRYSVSGLSVIAAAILTLAVEPLFQGKSPLFFFTLAAIISAAYGGVGPGLFGTGLSVAIIFSFLHADIVILAVAHSSVILFGALGVGISLTLGRLRKTNAALAGARDRLEVANEKLSERTEALSQANDELQRFAYALAHDLNAPLRGVSVLTELFVQLNAEKLDERSKECAGMIVNKVQRMQSMIKGLLDYAAAVEKPEERAPLDSKVAVERAMQDLDSAIKQCDAQITIGPLPWVPASEGHLVQVFSNLISNAIKYRASIRQPQVCVSASERGGDWVFCVSDNGIGLDMKYADEIFGMFRRLHTENNYEGSGIGLALCKIVVQRHGGWIWVESEVGRGCRFYFTLPKKIGEQQTPTPERGVDDKACRPANRI